MLGIYEEEEIRAIAEQVRHFTKTEKQYTTATMPLGVSEVYNAGKVLSTRLFGLYILKEPITSEDLIVGGFEEYFPADSVYAYFYDSKINDYVYLPVEWLYRSGDFYDWNTTDGYTAYSKVLRDGKWGYYWYIESTGESGDGLYPDIKGRIIVFTKPTVVSENFYNLFMATTNGAEENFDEGKQAEYDRFWDAYQDYGNRTDYTSAFYGFYWNKETLRPKYTCKVVGEGGTSMFNRCFWNRTSWADLLDISHISIDVTEATNCYNMFSNANIKSATLRFSNKVTSLNTAFSKNQQSSIEGMEITLLVPNPNCDWTNAFSYHNVKELNLLEGTVIGTDGFNVQWATALPKASIISVINALSDSTSGLSITLSKTARDNAFEGASWIKLASSKPNWTINLI